MPETNFDKQAQSTMLTVGLGFASLKEQKAARKAQDAYNSKRLELEERGLGLQADQIAKQYAMQMAQLEWEKESFREQFGETVKQNEWERTFKDKELALENDWRVAEQTGFRDGVPTLANRQFEESMRQFNIGQENNVRDFGEAQRQFNVGQVLNAPRGPADWAAYTKKLRALQGSGDLPGAVGAMFDPSQRVASYSDGGQATGPVLSNTDLALAMTGVSPDTGLQGTPWQGVAPQPQPQNQTVYHTSSPIEGAKQYSTQPVGTPQPSPAQAPQVAAYSTVAPSGNVNGFGYNDEWSWYEANRLSQARQGQTTSPSIAAYSTVAPTGNVNGFGYNDEWSWNEANRLSQAQQQKQAPQAGVVTEGPQYTTPVIRDGEPRQRPVQTNSANPYSETGAPSGSAEAAAKMLGTTSTQSGPSNMALPSAQKFRRFAPTEQQMGLGYLAESGGPTEDDAQYLMQRQAPNFSRSRSARYAGL